MSEFHVNVYKLGPFSPHPNAETLDITKVFDYTVVAKRGNFKEGDLVVYVPIDSLVPDNETWNWLAPRNQDGSERFPLGQVPEKYRIIEAKKIRGIFSQGCLSPLPPGDWKEGDNVCDIMGIVKYEAPISAATNGECEAAPKGWQFPVYTDLEGLRRHPDVLQLGEEVIISEKIHGCNSRYVHDGERLWVGSHTQIKKKSDKILWWQVAESDKLEEKLSKFPFLVFFGECYGQVQDLKYGMKSGSRFAVFDVYDVKAQRYLDFDDAYDIAKEAGLNWVPILARGPWDPNVLNPLCEGKSTLADNVREGFVVRPVKEKWHDEVGRVILKRHGEGYLLRKKK